MSIVNNPYTFNIKSNCGFSTNTLLSNNKAKITMKYSSTDCEQEENEETIAYYTEDELLYSAEENKVGSMIPNVIKGNTIILIWCFYDYGDITSYGLYIKIKAPQRYSKIILNGGPFKNCSVPYEYVDSNGVQYYTIQTAYNIPGLDTTYNWKNYDNIPFDLTIEFVA